MAFLVEVHEIAEKNHGLPVVSVSTSKVVCRLPHGHRVEIIDTDTDVAVVMYYPDSEVGVALESVMKEV